MRGSHSQVDGIALEIHGLGRSWSESGAGSGTGAGARDRVTVEHSDVIVVGYGESVRQSVRVPELSDQHRGSRYRGSR